MVPCLDCEATDRQPPRRRRADVTIHLASRSGGYAAPRERARRRTRGIKSVVPARKRGEEEAGELLVNLNARIPKHLWRRVRLRCLREGRLLRTFITEALREHLREQKKRR